MSDISRDSYLRCQRKFKMQGTLKFLPFLTGMNVCVCICADKIEMPRNVNTSPSAMIANFLCM